MNINKTNKKKDLPIGGFLTFPINTLSFLIVFVVGISSGVAQHISASEVVSKALKYHDPGNEWPTMNAELFFNEIQPSGETRKTQVWIDNVQGFFKVDRGGTEIHGMKMDSCFVETGDFTCERAERLRNYYIYLWGLPMKLQDEGTKIRAEANVIDWQNTPCYEVVADYETDRWFFYFSRSNYKLVGYMFVKNDGSGEKIVLSGEHSIGKMRIPAIRSWFVISDGKYLGTDKLVRALTTN